MCIKTGPARSHNSEPILAVLNSVIRSMAVKVCELIRGTSDHWVIPNLFYSFYAAVGFLKSFVKSYCIEFMS